MHWGIRISPYDINVLILIILRAIPAIFCPDLNIQIHYSPATSDNLEAISEAASSHSVGSDLDNENDNLSDMVSANVSGRGTPNISGRDTPLSQVCMFTVIAINQCNCIHSAHLL